MLDNIFLQPYKCESPSTCFKFTHQSGRVLLSYLTLTHLIFEITTGLSFKLMNLFEFLLVKQLRATEFHSKADGGSNISS